MLPIMNRLLDDENGFIVSAELILVATIGVLSMIVGLSEVANNLNQELEDVASSFGSINQSFHYSGTTGHKGRWVGSRFKDNVDFCDSEFDIVCTSRPRGECDNF